MFIGSSPFMQVTRKTIKALMCSNFDGIPPLTLELAARKHLKIDTLAPSFLIGSSSFMQVRWTTILSLNKFEIRHDLTTYCGVSCP